MNKSNLIKVISVMIIVMAVSGVYIFKSYQKTHAPKSLYNQAQTQYQSQSKYTAGLPKLVNLGCEHCHYCESMKPIIFDLSKEYSGKIIIESIDIDEQQDATQKYMEMYTIKVVPTQLLIDKQGKLVWTNEGFIEKDKLKTILKDKVGIS